MYCTLSHMFGQVTSSANGQLYTIKINKDFRRRLLKRGDMSKSCIYRIPLSPDSCPTASGQRL